jgi:tRNA (Thr-GGU) A37 N-methylase
MQSIGVVRTSRTVAEHTPVHAALNPDEPGWVDLDPSLVEGLEGLDGFDYVWLVTWLGPVDGRPPEPVALRQVPYLLVGGRG